MVIRARGDDDAPGAQDRVAAIGVQGCAVFTLGEAEGERPRRRGKFCAETIGLKLRTVSQVAAADAGGKAEEVLDERGRTGLSARRIAFQNDGLESFGGG